MIWDTIKCIYMAVYVDLSVLCAEEYDNVIVTSISHSPYYIILTVHNDIKCHSGVINTYTARPVYWREWIS